jgi:RNA polymerase sigma factor (sigma-70 family)
MSREQQFLSSLPLIERVVAGVCARRGLRGADAEDFASLVKIRLIENDYEVLARFEGRSSLRTYLTVVVNRLYVDEQIRRFGRWRPSAQARRLGPVATRLERLLHRDRLSFDEACGVLLVTHGVGETREALYEMSLHLPYRSVRGRAFEETPAAGNEPAPSGLEQAELQALADRTFTAIHHSLGRLSGRDRVILRLHFESGLSIADIARSLGLDQKALYRRRDEVLRRVRTDVEAEGITPADASSLLATLDWDAEWTDGPESTDPLPEPGTSSPSQGREGQK